MDNTKKAQCHNYKGKNSGQVCFSIFFFLIVFIFVFFCLLGEQWERARSDIPVLEKRAEFRVRMKTRSVFVWAFMSSELWHEIEYE